MSKPAATTVKQTISVLLLKINYLAERYAHSKVHECFYEMVVNENSEPLNFKEDSSGINSDILTGY